MINVLVTGGAGFIGSHIVDILIQNNYNVFIIDNLSSGFKNNINDKAVFSEGDILDHIFLEEFFSKYKIDVIIHHAAHINLRKSIENPHVDANINIMGSLNLLNLSIKNKIRHFIFASTGGALYGETNDIPTTEDHICNPQSPYGIAKFSVENYIRFFSEKYNLKTTILRYSNVYGPRQNSVGEAGVVSIFIDKIRNSNTIEIFGDGNQTRDFVYVMDVAKVNLEVVKNELTGIYNISTGVENSINDVCENIIFKMNKINENIQKIYIDSNNIEQRRSCLSNKKILNIFPSMFFKSFPEGLDDFLNESNFE